MRWFAALLAAVGCERVAELVVARRNERWAREHGAVETGAGHYPAMVALHTGLLAGSLVEARLARRAFRPALGWPMLALVAGSQALRWWCIATLGRQWNTRILVIPGAGRVHRGPYRLLPHPNYVAVAVEGAALPLVGRAWLTAAAFSALNAALLRTRIAAENTALQALGTVPTDGS